MVKAEKYYKEKIKNINKEINKLNTEILRVSWLRFFIILIGGVIAYSFYKGQNNIEMILSISATIVIFAVVAVYHGKKIEKRNELEVWLEVNDKGIKRLNGQYKEFEDIGVEFIDESHQFCQDLDIFGKSSLFQMINTTRTKSGRKRLAEILSLNKFPQKETIEERQVAIEELSNKIEWRQKLYVSSTFRKKNKEELEELIRWSTQSKKFNRNKLIIAGLFIAITMTTIFFSILGKISVSVLILNLIINYGVIKILTNDMNDVIKLFNSIKNSIRGYSNILALIEEEEFESKYLKKLCLDLKGDVYSCKQEMKKLVNLLDWIGDSTGNAYFFLINILAFADVFILYNLDKWKDINGEKVESWLKIMGEFDALSSIANIRFDHEEWCTPKIVCEKSIICEKIKHPLITKNPISNDYSMKDPKQCTLITGSNMSGKSTFLRTIGINLVLAYIGAPCSANSFSCSIMNIYTCMRTKDNLEESISSFYAEILRIKLIIDACKKGERVFFLLDEIFKGTNSNDRHIGATVLIKQLISNGAMGLLSTHDLELCDLEESVPEVSNYNFREYYEDSKIMFDYILREGKSTTQNAVYLMKLAGIDI